MLKVIVYGSEGRMGKHLQKLIEENDNFTLAAGVDAFSGEYKKLSDFSGDADVIIDFSNHVLTNELCEYAKSRKIPVVIATTGHTAEEKELILEASKSVAVFQSANMSIGIALLVSLAKQAAAAFPNADIEIVEAHHNRKLDAPSGTALLLANEIKTVRKNAEYKLGRAGNAKREKSEIGIHAVRAGNIVGDHEIIICTDSQTLKLTHQAHDRALFAEGALTAAEFIAKVQNPGMYDMKDLMK